MKPAAFEYDRPANIDLALKALAAAGADGRVIAGGQTLGPMLNMRLTTPSRLVDLGSVAPLKRIEKRGGTLIVGSGVTHAALEDRADNSPTGRLLSRVAAGIAFRAIRNRGTIGGSLAHADPAADWLTAMILLDASINLVGPHGSRQVPARAFCKGAFATALGADEILESVELTELSSDARWGYYKICRKTGEFPEALGAVVLDPQRRIARVVAGALDGPPALLATLAVAVAKGGLAAADLPAVKVAVRAAAPSLDPVDLQIHAVAVRRAISEAVAP
jgi:aerobic carbon-monoxide dehydrogenase medium subunit